MCDLVERLKNEKVKFIQQCEQLGYKDGLMHAERLSYEEFLVVAEIEDAEQLYNSSIWGDWLNERASSFDPPFDEDAYSTGWLKAINEKWAELNPQLD